MDRAQIVNAALRVVVVVMIAIEIELEFFRGPNAVLCGCFCHDGGR